MICECGRCGTDTSVFWYPVSIGGEYAFDLCDKCMTLLWEFLKEGSQ